VPTWGEIGPELLKIQQRVANEPNPKVGPYDILRRKYLAKLHQRTGRATFLYYSGWMDKPNAGPEDLSVVGADVCGFMEACSNAAAKNDRKLDFFIHSPGGDPDAAEQICEYLRTQYDHIRVIVPLQAMSAATMMALSADEVLMGDHSQLGPIDDGKVHVRWRSRSLEEGRRSCVLVRRRQNAPVPRSAGAPRRGP
jgi:ClpP class serine protease